MSWTTFFAGFGAGFIVAVILFVAVGLALPA